MSTMTNGIGWFEIGTSDVAAAERFYGQLFGWRFADDQGSGQPYRLITTPAAGSVHGGVFATEGRTPSYAVFYVEVADVAASCVAAEAAGGKVLVPVSTTDDGLVFAHLLDPSGSHFGIYTPAPDRDA